MAGKEGLGKSLRALQLRRGGPGPKAGQAFRLESVHHASNQGRFGTDNGEGHTLILGQRNQSREIHGIQGHIANLGLLRRPGVPWGHQDLRHLRAAGSRPG